MIDSVTAGVDGSNALITPPWINMRTQLNNRTDKIMTDCSPKPVRLDERLLHRIGVREWGMPSICMPGKIWRSEKHGTITCMTPHDDASKVKIETLPLVVIPAGEMSWLPDSWRASLWEYVQAWPYSGHGLGPLLAITEEQRCDFIRNWAKKLAESDNIGCCSIANAIGEFAAYGYELSENKDQPISSMTPVDPKS